jgi:hypothetical protein
MARSFRFYHVAARQRHLTRAFDELDAHTALELALTPSQPGPANCD